MDKYIANKKFDPERKPPGDAIFLFSHPLFGTANLPQIVDLLNVLIARICRLGPENPEILVSK